MVRGAAQAVLPVAVGDAEAAWVERAATETVRALRAAVRAAGRDPRDPDDAEEPWLRFCAPLPPPPLHPPATSASGGGRRTA